MNKMLDKMTQEQNDKGTKCLKKLHMNKMLEKMTYEQNVGQNDIGTKCWTK